MILITDVISQSSNFCWIVLDETTYYISAFAVDSNGTIIDVQGMSIKTDFLVEETYTYVNDWNWYDIRKSWYIAKKVIFDITSSNSTYSWLVKIWSWNSATYDYWVLYRNSDWTSWIYKDQPQPQVRYRSWNSWNMTRLHYEISLESYLLKYSSDWVNRTETSWTPTSDEISQLTQIFNNIYMRLRQWGFTAKLTVQYRKST